MAHSCYVCNVELSSKNTSEEHILLNALGGRLKSKTLLCKSCNSGFGETIDAKLVEQLSSFATLLNVKRDRGQTQPFLAEHLDTGEPIYVQPGGGGRFKIKAPEITPVDETTIRFKLEAPDMKTFRQQLKSLQRKYPKLDIEQALKECQSSETRPNSEFQFSPSFGGPEVERSVCKSVLNYYLSHGHSLAPVNHLIPYIQKGLNNKNSRHVNFFYPARPFEVYASETVNHSISVFGRPQEQLLFGYINYFNILNYLVILNDTYTGPALEHVYSYDLLQNAPLETKTYQHTFSREQLLNSIHDSLQQTDINGIAQGGRYFLSKYSELLRNKKMEALLRQACSDLKEGDLITTKHLLTFSELFTREIALPLILQRHSRQDGLV